MTCCQIDTKSLTIASNNWKLWGLCHFRVFAWDSMYRTTFWNSLFTVTCAIFGSKWVDMITDKIRIAIEADWTDWSHWTLHPIIVAWFVQLITRNCLLQCSWWRHQMEIFSASLALCAGNSPVTGEFPSNKPVTRSFDVFFDLRLNKRLSKQCRRRWFGTPSRSLWRHCETCELTEAC